MERVIVGERAGREAIIAREISNERIVVTGPNSYPKKFRPNEGFI